MAEPNNIPIVCRNGHQQPDTNSRFCIFCGTPLNAQSPQQSNLPQSKQHQQSNQPPQFNQQLQQPPFQIPPSQTPPFQNHPPTQFGQNNYPNQPPQFPPNWYPQLTPYPPYPQYQPAPPVQCSVCGINGERLDAAIIVCRECGWLRPLVDGYAVDCSAFQWAEDGRAMSALRSLTPPQVIRITPNILSSRKLFTRSRAIMRRRVKTR